MREEPYLLERAASLIAKSRYSIAFVGAGLSAESGIPTFRGEGGLWTRFGEPDGSDWERFKRDPAAWWGRQNERQEGRDEFGAALANAKPNPGHIALAEMERHGVIRAIVTQNIDNLHQVAGSQRVLEFHGNRTKLRCIECGARFPREEFTLETLPPRCPLCAGVVKSDTVMFGEPIPQDVLEESQQEALLADLVLVIGTSAVVYPAAQVPLIARQRGAVLIEVNPSASAISEICNMSIRLPAGEALPAIAALLTKSRGS
jgi:NAD-dependent deacetylase